MGQFLEVIHGLKPVILMVFLQAQFAGMNMLYRLAIEDGINIQVLVAYRLMFATAFMVPLALILESGFLPLNLSIKALSMTSATFTSAMANLRPVMTFIMSIFFGLETLGIGRRSGQAKLLGTCLGIGGGMLLTFYKGTVINLWETNVNLLDLVHHHKDESETTSVRHDENPVFGALFCVGGSFSSAIWLILQTKMSSKYPSCLYSSSAMMCVMATIQSVALSVCMERNRSLWKLNNPIRILTASYSGIVSFGLSSVISSWCAHKRGPLFVANFSPLSAITVAISANLLLHEKLHLGSVLGAFLIVCGLYAMLWGKSKEMKKNNANEETLILPKSTQNLEETTTSRPSIASNNVNITVDGNVHDNRPVLHST